MNKFKNAWKAGVGFIAPGATVIIASTLSSSAGGDSITKAEWIVAVCTAIVSASAIYATPPGKNLKTPVGLGEEGLQITGEGHTGLW